MPVRSFQVIHEHRAPHRAARRAFQPCDVVFNDEPVDMPIVVIVADAHGNRAPVCKVRLAVMIAQLLPTICANWHFAMAAELATERFRIKISGVAFLV